MGRSKTRFGVDTRSRSKIGNGYLNLFWDRGHIRQVVEQFVFQRVLTALRAGLSSYKFGADCYMRNSYLKVLPFIFIYDIIFGISLVMGSKHTFRFLSPTRFESEDSLADMMMEVHHHGLSFRVDWISNFDLTFH